MVNDGEMRHQQMGWPAQDHVAGNVRSDELSHALSTKAHLIVVEA